MKKRTVIQRCNSWINSPGKAGKQWKEVSVSLAFDFVFVYLRPHFSKGGYCAQRRRVPVPGPRAPTSNKTPDPNHAATLPPTVDYPLHLLQLRKCQNVKYSGILPSKKFPRGLKTPFALKLLNCYTWLKTEVRRNSYDFLIMLWQ